MGVAWVGWVGQGAEGRKSGMTNSSRDSVRAPVGRQHDHVSGVGARSEQSSGAGGGESM